MRDLTVVFDLDGTLVETAPDLIGATNHVLSLINLGPDSPQTRRPLISFGSRAMIETALSVHGRTLDASAVDSLWQEFLAYYARNIAVESHAYPGLELALDRLLAAGVRLAVCTNKQEHLSRQLLGSLQLLERFAAIAGRDTFAVHKPNPGHLTGVIAQAGGDPTRAIMVGDSDTDVKTARAANIPVIGVPFGYTDVPMQDLGADVVIENYSELQGAIAQIAATKWGQAAGL